MSRRQTWKHWRGSPLLLAHVARTMQSAIEAETRTAADSVIDIEIDGDHERFASASDFQVRVTQDALRHFSRIVVGASNQHASCELVLAWSTPSWRRYRGTAAHVELVVDGPDDAAASRMFKVVQPAVRRGRTKSDQRHELAFRGLFGVTFAVGILSAFYLLGVHDRGVQQFSFPLSILIAGACTGWLFPALEVVPSGDTKRLRVLRVVGPIVVSVILAGVTKKLFG
jgi:hypothetical protein